MNVAKPLIFDHAGHIASDVQCASCEYNLRTQPADGRCPECNSSIQQSCRLRFLEFANPQWLSKCKLGLFLICVAIMAAGLCIVGAITAFVILVFSSGPFSSSPSVLPEFMEWSVEITGFATGVTMTIGLFFFTKPDQTIDIRPKKIERPRKLIRRMLLITWVGVVLAMGVRAFLWLFGGISVSPRMVGAVVASALALISMIFCLVLLIAFWQYLRQFCIRMSKPGLAKYAHIQYWLSLVWAALAAFAIAFLISFTVVSVATAVTTSTVTTVTTMPSSAPTAVAQPIGVTTPPATVTTTQPTAVVTTTMPNVNAVQIVTPPPMPMPRMGTLFAFGFLSNCVGWLMLPLGISGAILLFLVLLRLKNIQPIVADEWPPLSCCRQENALDALETWRPSN